MLIGPSGVTPVSFHNLRRDIGAVLVPQLDVVGHTWSGGALCLALVVLSGLQFMPADARTPGEKNVRMDLLLAGIMPVRPLTVSLCCTQVIRPLQHTSDRPHIVTRLSLLVQMFGLVQILCGANLVGISHTLALTTCRS